MSTISRLPESTTRLLCSPLAITTPVSLVKELLDNSIDAKATSIEVIISADTVKKIEVRDNGIGIHPDDYDALGRRGHTSKLRSFEELRTQFGKTLGFRGEALASANSLAQVTVTTKIASEPVAAILHIQPDKGGILKQQPTSAPVGTTVSITGLFHKLPVREQMAIKDSVKAIAKIRELLCSYTMARPQLKYSLRVLQLPKQNWNYSPNLRCSVKEAAVQLFGPDITTYCFEKISEISDLTSSNDSSVKHQELPLNCKYVFEAFILKPDLDHPKFSKQRYFSVDSRPVIAKRGTMKKLLDIYVEHISVSRQDTPTTKSKNYFIRLNIKCPPGSYDANIEASKDDVVFSDEKIVLGGFKDLCKEVYNSSPSSNPHSQLPAKRCSISNKRDDLGAQKPPSTGTQVKSITNRVEPLSSSVQISNQTIVQPALQGQQALVTSQSLPALLEATGEHTHSPVSFETEPNSTQISSAQAGSKEIQSLQDNLSNTGFTQYRVDMSTDFNEYGYNDLRSKYPGPAQALPTFQEKLDAVKNSAPEDVNPWIIAKMNAPIPGRIVEERIRNEPVQKSNSPLSVFESPMTPDPPILRHIGAAPRDLDVPPSQQHLESQAPLRQLRPRVPGGPYRSPISRPSGMPSQNAMSGITVPTTLKPRRHRNSLPWSPPSSTEAAVISKDRLTNPRDDSMADGMKQTTISFRGARGNRKRQLQEDSSGINHQDSQGQEYQENNWFQYVPIPAKNDFGHKLSLQKAPYVSEKKQHQIHVNPKVAQDRPCVQSRKHHPEDEFNSSKINEPINTTLASGDPRAYLLRRQKSIAAEESGMKPKKIRRLKSSLLPLENVPSYDQTHSLTIIEVWNTETLRISVKKYATYDRYVTKGVVENGLEMSLDEGRNVEERLKLAFLKQMGADDGEEFAPEVNICSFLKGKGAVASS
ncbi:hypothetical protein F4813DRAFT_401435 [Daldinia decipiens]|uniref:uncharacterized protein n=1 Tax=Daldinia decipiens TaxID=326647 RepID=UPI0020C3E036|nr:uncharacterized protein F4813DRAFT_401435 [Daldinia decipiens]KAI1659882.1 hypothetical protein F4813DRAFT_401435 [Daldinia decipiens]